MADLPPPRRVPWRLILLALIAAWCTSIGLFFAGIWEQPRGWLVILVLIGWTIYKIRTEPAKEESDDGV